MVNTCNYAFYMFFFVRLKNNLNVFECNKTFFWLFGINDLQLIHVICYNVGAQVTTSTPASPHMLQTVRPEHQHHYMLMVFILASQKKKATQASHAAVIQHTSAHTYYLNHYRQ